MGVDKMCWKLSPRGVFDVRSYYRALQPLNPYFFSMETAVETKSAYKCQFLYLDNGFGLKVLAILTASFGVTVYSLPWDQIGYWAVKIVTGIPKAIPVIGLSLVELLRRSASVGQSTLTRFYSFHTCITSTYCHIYVNALPNDT